WRIRSLQTSKRVRRESRRRQNRLASIPGSNPRKDSAKRKAPIPRRARSKIAISLGYAGDWIGVRTRSQNAIHVDPISRKIDQLSDPPFQPARSEEKEQRKERVGGGEEELDVPGLKEMVDEQGQDDEIYDHDSGDIAISKLNTGQAFSVAVIFCNRPQNDAPPEVTVNLDVPFLPAGIDRVAPVFLIKKRENFL